MFVRLYRIILALLLVCLSAPCRAAHVASKDSNWPTYGASFENTRHFESDGINSSNVAHLAPVWRFVLGSHERVETTPIVVGRTMYATTGVGNTVVAIDAGTGKAKWRYRPAMGFMSPCCGAINRGVAVAHGRVFFATLDARLIALDAENGKLIWSTQVGDPVKGFSETMAPLAWNGMVFVGSSGSDYGIRGTFNAYRASDGKMLWRWYSVSRGWEGAFTQGVHGLSLHRDIAREKRDDLKYPDAWKHGGGAVWMTPALDARSATLYVSTGNPAPVFDGSVRPGDNLYTDSIVALDARTGKMRWYYQQTPHDVWEYEAASPPVLLETVDGRGKPLAAVAEAGKTRWLYVLRRSDGKLLRLSQSWAANSDVYDDPPSGVPTKPLQLRGTIGPIAYDPGRHFAFVTAIDRSASLQDWSDYIVAVNVENGRIGWKRRLGIQHPGARGDPVLAGALSANDLVFVSDPDGDFYALNAATGRGLWHYLLGADEEADLDAAAPIRLAHRLRDWLSPLKRWMMHQDPPSNVTAGVDASPIAYEIGGRQYIAIGFNAQPEKATGGAAICAFALSNR